MSKILNQKFIVVVALVIFVTSGFIVHSPQSNNMGRMSQPLMRGPNQSVRTQTTSATDYGTFYLTTNLSVANGTSYTIRDENLVVQSLSLMQISLRVSGSLNIINSSITLSQAQYSMVREFNINLDNGSFFNLVNSSIIVSGAIVMNGSRVFIENSNINSTGTISSNPSESTLKMQVNNSVVNVVNSSLSGLYNQKMPMEYNDGQEYLYESGFSQNAVVPVKSSFSVVNRSYINSIRINVTYYGNSNESNDSLMVYYNNTYFGSLPLPYLANQSSREASFTLNFTGPLHNLTWMENTTNFRLKANISYYAAIALSNLTENMMSNDTVDLLGEQYFSYSIDNSTILVFNSSLGLNQESYSLSSGEPNYGRLSMDAFNSELYFGDIALKTSGVYNEPFFSLTSSRLFLFREVNVEPSYNGISYTGLNFTVLPTNANGSYAISSGAFTDTLTSLGDNWLSSWNEHPILYETTNNGNAWNYTSQFWINATPGQMPFSLEPYPALSRAPFSINYTLPVPYAKFSSGSNLTSFYGNLSIGYNGNLTGLKEVNLTWTLYKYGVFKASGNATMTNLSKSGNVVIRLNRTLTDSPGEYNISVHFSSRGLHVFENSGNVFSDFYVSPAPISAENVTISETGLGQGIIWGVQMNNSEIFSNSSSIRLSIEGPQNVTFVVPKGYSANLSYTFLDFNKTSYSVNFHRIFYSLKVENRIPGNRTAWQLVVDGHKYSTFSHNLTVTLPPGVYNYQVIDPSGFKSTNSSGIVNLTDSSANVTVISVKGQSLAEEITQDITSPHYYVPISFMVLVVVGILLRNSYHRWYVCNKCGATRKRKRDKCPYCGN